MPPTPINSTSPLFPVALACDSNGDVYLASYFYPPSVLPAGSVDEIQAGNPTTKNLIQQAGTVYSGITVDSDGGVFVLSTTETSVGWLGTTLFGETGFIDRVSNGTTTPAFTSTTVSNTSRLISNGLGNFLLTIAASDSKPTVFVQAAPGNAVAGNGIANFKDGVQATLGELNSPSGLAVDACGSIYVADSGNNVIRKILNPNTAGTSACASGAPPTGPFPALTASLNIVQGNGQITAPGSVTFYLTEGIQNCTTQCTTAGLRGRGVFLLVLNRVVHFGNLYRFDSLRRRRRWQRLRSSPRATLRETPVTRLVPDRLDLLRGRGVLQSAVSAGYDGIREGNGLWGELHRLGVPNIPVHLCPWH